MKDASKSKTAPVLAWIAGILLVLLTLWGLIAHGVSLAVHNRFWRDIADRPGGPMTFRFILQPTMAFIVALADGLKDARTGRSPYLWTLLTSAQERGERLHEGLLATGRIILLSLGMDALYQATVLKTFYPGEMVLIALLLAFLPYALLRGPIARIARWWSARQNTSRVRGG